jgi:hypothetical protein
MPKASDAADVVLLDAQNDYALRKIDETRGWNPQQGTMFFWNPAAPDRELFFNDRDAASGEAFTVLYDIEQRRRVREFRFPQGPVANGGVRQGGGQFAAINYGRLARLREVTGYPEAADWTAHARIPEDDGVFVVDIATGERKLICSFRRMADKLAEQGVIPKDADLHMFLNHTLWNPEGDWILFYARSGKMWGPGSDGDDLNATFTVRPDGSNLTYHGYVGGHAEWAPHARIIAEGKAGLTIYDAVKKQTVGTIGNSEIFFDPKGDKALSPDNEWLAHGNCVHTPEGQSHQYALYRMADGFHAVSPLFSRGKYTSGSLRLDPAPCWNRAGTELLVPGIAADGTRQLFVITLR